MHDLDVPLASSPYEQPGANVAFWVLVALFVVGEWAMRLRSLLHRRGARQEGWSLPAVVVGVVGGLLGGFAGSKIQATTIAGPAWPLFVIGIVLMAAGIAVRQWAIFTLGRLFTADVRVGADQEVVDRGPYRWVRHPSYSGMIVFFVGLGLALDNWVSLVVLGLVPTAGLVVRIRSEERALLAGLGEPYRRFCATRAHLFPGLW